jgi:VanZ family protein
LTAPAPVAKRGGYFIHVVPAVIYVFAIFYGGLIPAPHVPGPEFHAQDKFLHAVAFGLMTFVIYRAVCFVRPKLAVRPKLGLSFGAVLFLGGFLEILQAFTSYRSAELLDFVADGVGAAIVVALLDFRARRSSE